jgi:hypothetical protein
VQSVDPSEITADILSDPTSSPADKLAGEGNTFVMRCGKPGAGHDRGREWLVAIGPAPFKPENFEEYYQTALRELANWRANRCDRST